MKKVYWSLILIFHVNFLFAQLNIVDKTAITQQTQQGNLQVLGKPDFNIDKYFIPYDKIVWRKPSHDFKPNENVTEMKLYVKSEEKEINLCINHNDSTITLKSIPEGYYEISGIIRFRENFNFHMNAFANYKFVENDSLFTSIEEYFECWKKEYLFSSFSLESAADFEKKVLVDKGKYSSNPIYVLSNGKGEDFYIDSNLEYFTRRSIKKAYYEIKKITRGKR